jgi:hypothetical protein
MFPEVTWLVSAKEVLDTQLKLLSLHFLKDLETRTCNAKAAAEGHFDWEAR